jgi:hypothetical protein
VKLHGALGVRDWNNNSGELIYSRKREVLLKGVYKFIGKNADIPRGSSVIIPNQMPQGTFVDARYNDSMVRVRITSLRKILSHKKGGDGKHGQGDKIQEHQEAEG